MQSAAKAEDVVALVNISTEKWPPRHRTYFGSLAVSSPQPGEAFAITHADPRLSGRNGSRRQAHHGIPHHRA
jgi:hypothetical protein